MNEQIIININRKKTLQTHRTPNIEKHTDRKHTRANRTPGIDDVFFTNSQTTLTMCQGNHYEKNNDNNHHHHHYVL